MPRELRKQSYPQYWIAAPCRHWKPEQNERFKLYRVDTDPYRSGHSDGAVWDAVEKRWLECSNSISLSWLKRPARPDELPNGD